MYGTKAIYRTPGSIDVVGAVRSALLIARDPDDEEKRIMVMQKANLAPTGSAIIFSVSDDGVTIIGEIEKTADEVLGSFSGMCGRPDDRTQEAIDFIRSLLVDGEEHSASECEARLKEAGIKSTTAKKAKRKLGVVSTKRQFSWFWSLPE
jgi:hypothetical protein